MFPSWQQNTALEINEKKIHESERRIKLLTEELETRNQKLDVSLLHFDVHHAIKL